MLDLKRRDFITLLGGAAAAWPLAARAQPTTVVGFLNAQSPNTYGFVVAAFRKGLSEVGYVEGQNLTIEYRWANGKLDQLKSLAADLVAAKVAVILASGSNVAVQTAIAATQSIPIVFTTATDPVTSGLVASLNRPGGNVTGVTLINTELGAKRLELLRELLTNGNRIALLINPKNPATLSQDKAGIQDAARRIGLEIIVLAASTQAEIEKAFEAASNARSAALLLGTDALFISASSQIADLGLRHKLPVISNGREGVSTGCLMSYGPSIVDMYQ